MPRVFLRTTLDMHFNNPAPKKDNRVCLRRSYTCDWKQAQVVFLPYSGNNRHQYFKAPRIISITEQQTSYTCFDTLKFSSQDNIQFEMTLCHWIIKWNQFYPFSLICARNWCSYHRSTIFVRLLGLMNIILFRSMCMYLVI